MASPTTSISTDKLKRLLAVPFGASDPSGDGWPRGIDPAGALTYFNDKYNGPTIPLLVTLLNIFGKRIVSIGSGFGGEEMRFAMLGENEVHCIEPDAPSCEFHAERQRAFPNANVVLHHMTMDSFLEQEGEARREAFDLIYSSSPGDWMRGDFRDVLPDAYARFFDHFGAPQSLVIFKLYGGSHDKFVLDSSWFLRSLVHRFSRSTRYRVAGYWTTGRGTALVVAHTPALTLPPLPAELPLSGVTARLTYSGEDLGARGRFDVFIPYAIAAAKIAAFIRGQVRKVISRLAR